MQGCNDRWESIAATKSDNVMWRSRPISFRLFQNASSRLTLVLWPSTTVTPDGSTVYVPNSSIMDNTVSVIPTSVNMVTGAILGFSQPNAFGVFIGPAPASGAGNA